VWIGFGGYMRGLGFLFWLSFLDSGDISQFVGEMFCLRDGQLSRKQFYVGQIVVYTILAIIIAPIFLVVLYKTDLWKMDESVLQKVVWAVVYFTITPVQLSAFIRRLNDAAVTRLIALVLLFPLVGNVLATLIGAVLPTNYGVERYY
jgi:uncharacterized membrane protein YhaH (DUF805 family)